jgi:hypothetical protein
MMKKRRNPENSKQFVRICVECENLFLRKTLFEEFWNEKIRKEHEIKLKQEEKVLLLNKIKSREEENIKRQKKKSELKLSSKLLSGIQQQINALDEKIKSVENKTLDMSKEQIAATEAIVEENNILLAKEEKFERLNNQKDFFKSQQRKDMHRKQDLKLKIKFFLDKVIEKNNIDKKSGKVLKKDQLSEKISLSKAPLTESEKKKLKKNKKKFKKKNSKLDSDVSICGGCKGCRIF